MPDWKEEIRLRIAPLGLKPTREAAIVDELAQDLEAAYDEALREGETPEGARSRALDELGESELLTRELRRTEKRADPDPVVPGAVWGLGLFADLKRDILFGARMLAREKGFTAVALLSLALGIGANTAIFQLLNAVRLRNLPVRAPGEIAEIRLADMEGARGNFYRMTPTVSNPIWEEFRKRQQIFESVFAWGGDSLNLPSVGEVRLARTLWASGGLFEGLGVRPALGRLLAESDDQRGCGSPGAVLSHSFWQREFGGDLHVIGKKVTLSDHPIEIIGVAAPGFFGMEVGSSFDVALPLCADEVFRGKGTRLTSGTAWWLTMMGRLKSRSFDQASASTKAMSSALFETTLPPDYPPVSVSLYRGFKLITVPAGSGISPLREQYEGSLWLLLSIAGLVLLIACANLANLLLARAAAREREIASRQALGASRGRLVRQLLTESLMLAVAGAALGAALAQGLSRVLVSYLDGGQGVVFLDLSPDARVLAFATGVAVMTCLLFGLVPALRVTRLELAAVMRSAGRGLTAGRERFSLRRGLVVAQVALSLVLVASALLFSRSLSNLLNVNAGFRQDGVLIAGIGFRRLNLPPERSLSYRAELADRLRGLPGVESVAMTNLVPMRDSSGNNMWIDGADPKTSQPTNRAQVGPEYFKTLQIPLLAGREFDLRDIDGAPDVAVVNEAFARAHLGGGNPVGRRLWIEKTPYEPQRSFEIVGLVGNTKYGDLREDFQPIAYIASTQTPTRSPGGMFLVRSRVGLAQTTAAIKKMAAEISPSLTLSFEGLKPMIDSSILRERLVATLSGFFGLLAFVLASIGLHGMLAYGVSSRMNEIGIRMTLGATTRSVSWLIVREALALVALGVLVGLPAVYLSGRFAATLLFGLTSADPYSMAGAVVVMLLVAIVACYFPARRATRIDPLAALRCE